MCLFTDLPCEGQHIWMSSLLHAVQNFIMNAHANPDPFYPLPNCEYFSQVCWVFFNKILKQTHQCVLKGFVICFERYTSFILDPVIFCDENLICLYFSSFRLITRCSLPVEVWTWILCFPMTGIWMN